MDTTTFKNIDNEPYDIIINNEVARHFEAGEEQIVPVFVAKVGAKHLVDKLLFKKKKKEGKRLMVNQPSPLRNELTAQIVPEIATEIEYKPLTEEEYREEMNKRMSATEDLIKGLGGKIEEKDKKLEKQSEEIKKLKEEIKKGREQTK